MWDGPTGFLYAMSGSHIFLIDNWNQLYMYDLQTSTGANLGDVGSGSHAIGADDTSVNAQADRYARNSTSAANCSPCRRCPTQPPGKSRSRRPLDAATLREQDRAHL